MKILEHAPEHKEHLAEHLAEIVHDRITVEKLTDILNGKEDGVSWDVTHEEVVTALDALVEIRVCRRIKKGVYKIRADYYRRQDAGERWDLRRLLRDIQ